MLYYSDKARTDAIASIKDCIQKIDTIPGNYISYHDAKTTVKYLNLLIDEIEKESREDRRNFPES